MKNEQNDLERLKGSRPFTVPDGYMEGLTGRIMSQLPEKPRRKEHRISFADRVRPWLYLAAVFAGLGLFFRGITHLLPGGEEKAGALLVKTETTTDSPAASESGDEEDEYLQYIEDQYTYYLFAEELALGE